MELVIMSESGTTKQGHICTEIVQERNRQNEKWGKQEHNLVEWMAILTEEVGEASKEAVDSHFRNMVKTPEGRKPATVEDQIARLHAYRTELIQVMAVAMQMIEDLDERYL